MLVNVFQEYLQLIKKVGLSKNDRSGINLMDAGDNGGRLPIEYFLCFSTKKEIEDYSKDLSKIIESQGLEKPNWLNAKLLVAENNEIYSGIDNTPMSLWKQESAQEFRECLKTKQGKRLISMMAASDFRQKDKATKRRWEYDLVYCGTNIAMYTAPHVDELDRLLKLAKSRDEVKLYLTQSCYYIFHNRHEPIGWTNKSLPENTNKLMDKAIKLNLDVAEMKKHIINFLSSSRNRVKEFDGVMRACFNQWDDLEYIEERSKLLKTTKNKDIAINYSLSAL